MKRAIEFKRIGDSGILPAVPSEAELRRLVNVEAEFKAKHPDFEQEWEGMKDYADLPPRWSILSFDRHMSMYYRMTPAEDVDRRNLKKQKGLFVSVSYSKELDGKKWLHVSCSYKQAHNRMPSYQDMKEIKQIFIGPELTAYEVHAPESKHVNVHNFCRHLWACTDGPVTPDFSRGLGQI